MDPDDFKYETWEEKIKIACYDVVRNKQNNVWWCDNIGYTDAILHVDTTDLRAGPVVAADKLGTTVELQRSRSTLARIAAGLADAMVARGRHGDAARALAPRLTFTEDGHWTPLFPEHARELGLSVEVDPDDRRWYLLAYLSSWSHP